MFSMFSFFSIFKGAKGAKDAKLFKVLREAYLLAPLILYLLVSEREEVLLALLLRADKSYNGCQNPTKQGHKVNASMSAFLSQSSF